MSSKNTKGLLGRFIMIALLGFAMLLLAACGETPVPRDGGGNGSQEATEPEAAEPEATEPKATEPEATEPKATEPEATEPEATEPSAPAVAADGTMNIELKDFKIVPAEIVVKAGDVNFKWDNTSTHAHNYRITKMGDTNAIIYPGPKVGAKKKQTKTIKLEPGEYYVFCNLSDHEKRGMKGKMTVQ